MQSLIEYAKNFLQSMYTNQEFNRDYCLIGGVQMKTTPELFPIMSSYLKENNRIFNNMEKNANDGRLERILINRKSKF